MMESITLKIPPDWLEGLSIGKDELGQALLLGLTQLRRQQAAQDSDDRIVRVLLSTGRIQHLSPARLEKEASADRQEPPTLPGPPVSEILIAQRRGEL